MRRELKQRDVKSLKEVYSDEQPIHPSKDMSVCCSEESICSTGEQHAGTGRRSIPGSTAFVPSVAGLIIAGEVIKDLTSSYRKEVDREV
jgi:tRNA A37 threonylcarbamoyladenosine dehydratase